MGRKKAVEKIYCPELYRDVGRERLFIKLRNALGSMGKFYGFEQLHTPVFDDARFVSSMAKAGLLGVHPVLCKTRSGLDVALRPTGVLGVLRAYTLQQMSELPHPLKFLFEGDRFFLASSREAGIVGDSEMGLVMIGEESPVAEAEIIQSFWKTLGEMGTRDVLELKINAIGCTACHSSFRSQLNSYFRSKGGKLCKNCKRLLKNIPTRILRCEDEKCQMVATRAPQVLDFLCDQCKKHLRQLLEFLDEAHIPYFLDARLFREGSLFEKFVFEIVVNADIENGETPSEETAHKNNAKCYVVLAEGGRMLRAAQMVYGKPIDVVGGSILFAGAENVLINSRSAGREPKKPKVFLVQLGELAKRKSLSLLETLRAGGIDIKESLGRDSIKSQLKVAEHVGTKIALILGQKEALDGTIIVREVQSGIQETIPQDKLVEFLKSRLRK